jgi:putative ABC transport system permease protein
MIRFIKQKLLHKKWMVISLLIGNLFLAAIACSNPMYQNAALQKTLQSKLNRYIQENNSNPGVLTFESNVKEKEQREDYEKIQSMAQEAADRLGVEQEYFLTQHETTKTRGTFLVQRGNTALSKTLCVASMSGLDEHIQMMSGKTYADQTDADGYIEGIVSQRAFSKLGLVVGDVMELQKFTDASGNPVRIKIVGVFSNSEEEDSYWVNSPSDYYMEVFVSPALFEQTFVQTEESAVEVKTDWYMIYDYTAVSSEQVNSIVTETEDMIKTFDGNYNTFVLEPDYLSIFREYRIAAKKVTTTLLILQFPVLTLLLAFIFMISRQMLDLEKNEIALLKSRGSSKKQILLIYFLQSAILAVISGILGLPLGYFLCKILGSTNGFLEFIQRKTLHITLTASVFLYLSAAMIVSIAVMVLPVFRDADTTIVHVKQKNKKKRALWQRAYLDVILLLVSLYGLYSFTQRKDILMTQMLEGESLDPFLFICSSLFIISASLVAIRIQPFLVRLVYLLGKKHWSPAFFASFLQILRSRGKQSFMMVFLMLTVSLGIFNATVARTILSNSESNIRYELGTDLIVKEVWENNSIYLQENPNLELTYSEPDFSVYENMEGVEHATKVYREEDITTSVGKKDSGNEVSTSLMAIDTKNFGETITDFDTSLLPTHINNYLNALAGDANAILLSSNFHRNYDVQLGDKISYINEDKKTIEGVVYGFVDYFPGYVEESHELSGEDTLVTTENYLVIANLATVQQAIGVKPYEVWINTTGSSQFLYDYAKENNVDYVTFKDVSSELVEVKNDALFQGTNGILTMSFIVILVLCCAGFLIYWILSIRQRELLFGVFRAMGMTKREIIRMLINEQVFSSGLSILTGAGLGILSSWLFVPLVQIFYASTDQAVPLQVQFQAVDMVRLFSVIAVVIIVCMVVLGKLINRIHISQALKLGED